VCSQHEQSPEAENAPRFATVPALWLCTFCNSYQPRRCRCPVCWYLEAGAGSGSVAESIPVRHLFDTLVYVPKVWGGTGTCSRSRRHTGLCSVTLIPTCRNDYHTSEYTTRRSWVDKWVVSIFLSFFRLAHLRSCLIGYCHWTKDCSWDQNDRNE